MVGDMAKYAVVSSGCLLLRGSHRRECGEHRVVLRRAPACCQRLCQRIPRLNSMRQSP
nr:hypothetical protein GZ31B6_5 [uncultured archaeon GZfos31B6]